MKLTLRHMALTISAFGTLFASVSANAQISGDVVKIGFITDMSGLYADIDGQGGAEAIKMAIAGFGRRRSTARRSNSSPPTTRTRPTSPPARRANGSTSKAWTC